MISPSEDWDDPMPELTEAERIAQSDTRAITLDVAGVVRQMAGLPPMMEVMCIAEDGREYFLRPGSVSEPTEDGHSVIGPPLYFFKITDD